MHAAGDGLAGFGIDDGEFELAAGGAGGVRQGGEDY
jgi:hypothetical protein